MINTEWLSANAVLAVRPQGAVEEADFQAVAALVDPVITEQGRLDGLLLDARGFAGWDDTRALMAHLRFVNAHVDKVARIAVVGDQWWLGAAPAMEPLHGTPIRVFPAAGEATARAWLLETPAPPASVTILPESEGPVVGIRVTGRLRDADYKAFQSNLMARLPDSGRIRLLTIIDSEFRGWTPKASFDDFAMVFSPWRQRFEKLAVVAGPGFLHWCVAHFPEAMLPYPMKLFEPDQLDAAWTWLRA